jgi:hypothetical protein
MLVPEILARARECSAAGGGEMTIMQDAEQLDRIRREDAAATILGELKSSVLALVLLEDTLEQAKRTEILARENLQGTLGVHPLNREAVVAAERDCDEASLLVANYRGACEVAHGEIGRRTLRLHEFLRADVLEFLSRRAPLIFSGLQPNIERKTP